MSKIIFKELEEGIGREIDKMPYGLTKRQMRRLIDRALEKVIRKVGRECGIPNADIEETKKMFWDCDMSFPNFDDECYIQVMKGEKGQLERIGEFEQIKEPTKKESRDFTNDILVDGEWGANYDPQTKTMLGGYSLDGETFSPEFQITEIEEEDIAIALHICSALYSDYGNISAPYSKLVEEYTNRLN